MLSLERIFRGPRVLTLEELANYLGRSRSTALRRLKTHGYYSSYNKRGRFMTIEEVCRFDAHGLWYCKGARFSRQGTLKNTILHLVKNSEQGMTHGELATRLGLRVHDTLLDLVAEDKIQRQKLGPTYVYLSRKRSVQNQQARQRKECVKDRPKPHATSRQTIAVLLELIEDRKATRDEIVLRCRGTGVQITRILVDIIFDQYDLDKKRAR
jgi:predicted transcriptional regulator